LIKLFKIDGHSLYPILKDGERAVCFKYFPFNKIRIGDIVVFNKDPYGLMIKQVTDINIIQDQSGHPINKSSKSYFVKGTDPYSTDSRDFGHIHSNDIKYKLISWLHRKNL